MNSIRGSVIEVSKAQLTPFCEACIKNLILGAACGAYNLFIKLPILSLTLHLKDSLCHMCSKQLHLWPKTACKRNAFWNTFCSKYKNLSHHLHPPGQQWVKFILCMLWVTPRIFILRNPKSSPGKKETLSPMWCVLQAAVPCICLFCNILWGFRSGRAGDLLSFPSCLSVNLCLAKRGGTPPPWPRLSFC